MDGDHKVRALELIQREALLLDEQRWPEWLDLYDPDGVFWMPMWKAEAQATSDPETELSFIYMEGRQQLEERTRRVLSGRAVSSIPTPRTSHLVGPGVVNDEDAGKTVIVQSAFRSQVYLHKDNLVVEYAGRYTHQLVSDDRVYRIRRKTILLNCDYLQSKLDFFYI